MDLKNYGKLNIPDFIWWLGVVEDNNDLELQVIIQVIEKNYL